MEAQPSIASRKSPLMIADNGRPPARQNTLHNRKKQMTNGRKQLIRKTMMMIGEGEFDDRRTRPLIRSGGGGGGGQGPPPLVGILSLVSPPLRRKGGPLLNGHKGVSLSPQRGGPPPPGQSLSPYQRQITCGSNPLGFKTSLLLNRSSRPHTSRCSGRR